MEFRSAAWLLREFVLGGEDDPFDVEARAGGRRDDRAFVAVDDGQTHSSNTPGPNWQPTAMPPGALTVACWAMRAEDPSSVSTHDQRGPP